MPDMPTEAYECTIVDKHEAWTPGGPVLTQISDQDITAFRERAVVSTASPATFGLWAFATGTWMSATVLGGFLPWDYGLSTALVILLYAGFAQFIAGLYGFRRGLALQATAFTTFGMFNSAFGLMLLLQVNGAASTKTGLHMLLGFLLESFAFMALALACAAVRRNALLFGWLITACLGYCLTGVAQFVVSPPAAAAAKGAAAGHLGTAAMAGGALLLASTFIAYYFGLAVFVNSTWNRNALPIFGTP